jgi:hypothetical protein
MAAVDFLRKELGIKEDEVKDEDIVKAFPADDSNLQRVYVQFSTIEQAELCMNLTRKMRNPELKVVLYIPGQLKQRFHALKNEDYRLRKLSSAKYKTRIEYGEEDFVLFICPIGDFRFVQHPVHGLPPVDLAPVRTPPPGRKTKRTRSESASPKDVDKKKEKVDDNATEPATNIGNVGQENIRTKSNQDLN